MKADQLFDLILQNTYTLNTLKKRVKALRQQVNIRLFNLKVISTKEESEQAVWVSSLGKDILNEFTKEDFQEVFDRLEVLTEKAQPLVIYFAFEPGPSQVVMIGAWLRQNFGKNFIYDTKIDYSLIGGCAFVWKGVYHDYSVKARIAENKGRLIDEFRRYLKH